LVAFLVLVLAMLVAGLYPFNFFPENDVQWLSTEPGIYFNGKGISYTSRFEPVCLTNGVSVELLLKERFRSRNWGPKEIFSFYDGLASPPLLVGQWGGHIFLYSRLDKDESDKWFRLFRTQDRFPRGKPHLVTVTFCEDMKAIYIDGELNNERETQIHSAGTIEFCGRLLLANSPMVRNGWRGEVKGLAIYNRCLLPEEIIEHNNEVLQKGMGGLAKTPGCLALYLFNEREGIKAKSIVGKPLSFSIPKSRIPLISATLFTLPHEDMRTESLLVGDFLRNILFFLPYGTLLSAIIFRKYNIGFFAAFLIITSTGCFLSFTIEFLQLFLPSRISTITDVFSNTIGTIFGVLLAYVAKLKAAHLTR